MEHRPDNPEQDPELRSIGLFRKVANGVLQFFRRKPRTPPEFTIEFSDAITEPKQSPEHDSETPPIPRQAIEEKNTSTTQSIQEKEEVLTIPLTDYNHAILRVNAPNIPNELEYYIPLDSADTILATRTIEALAHLRSRDTLRDVSSTQIARQAWLTMTKDERRIFSESQEDAYNPDGCAIIEGQVLEILRKLTHRLFLTHEPKGDRFTLLDATVELEYHQDSLTKTHSDQLRPINGPISETVPSKDKQEELKERAHRYMTYAINKPHISDEEGVEMLNFIMSPEGHWAIRSSVGKGSPFGTQRGALSMMHKYLKRTFEWYRSAHTTRLISNHIRRDREGKVRQVSRRLPGSTNWSVGKNMNEILDRLADD